MKANYKIYSDLFSIFLQNKMVINYINNISLLEYFALELQDPNTAKK